jgi:hypothetical protein
MQLRAFHHFYADHLKWVGGGSTFEVEEDERAKQLVEYELAADPKRTKRKDRD